MPRKSAAGTATDAENRIARGRKNENWDEGLRLVGDARYVEVEWSKRDVPYWPLPKK